jgi:molecular chaperone IbpB/HSP20 family protein
MMRQRDFVDIGKLMDEVFSAAEDFSTVMQDRLNIDPRKEFYPFYSYPPANIIMKDDKSMVFEFALAGFSEEDIELEFRGDYMVLSATVPQEHRDTEGLHYLKKRLKLKDVTEQKYYVPEDKYDRENAGAEFKNGLLTVTVPSKEQADEAPGVRINIKSGESKKSGSGTSQSSGSGAGGGSATGGSKGAS